MSFSIPNPKNSDNRILGGSYRQVRDTNQGGQVHHIPANSISPLDKDDGPEIFMTTPDHQRTGSWGRGVQQRAYPNQQKYLIDTQGRKCHPESLHYFPQFFGKIKPTSVATEFVYRPARGDKERQC